MLLTPSRLRLAVSHIPLTYNLDVTPGDHVTDRPAKKPQEIDFTALITPR